MGDVLSVSREIAAPADAVWALVSDLPRMGELSPENSGGSWAKGAGGPAVGARFTGTNERGKRHWKTQVRVVTCEPGKRFEFDVTAGGLKVSRWGYALEPTAAGCTVTETWTDQRGAVVRTLGKAVTGVSDRTAHNRAGMEQTLAKIAAALEP
jgi:uncharacterized protein YndB with AHSA1/START domain